MSKYVPTKVDGVVIAESRHVDVEHTLDGYETEQVDAFALTLDTPEVLGLGFDREGNIVRFRKAEDATLEDIAASLNSGNDITVTVASCEVVSRKPAFEVLS